VAVGFAILSALAGVAATHMKSRAADVLEPSITVLASSVEIRREHPGASSESV
jgi:hypothetical protein